MAERLPSEDRTVTDALDISTDDQTNAETGKAPLQCYNIHKHRVPYHLYTYMNVTLI